MTKALTVYGRIVSPFVARVILAARYKGMKYELSVPQDGIKTPSYYKLNPLAKVPVLIDGKTVLFESSVIVEYLEAKSKTKKLLPASAKAAAQARMIAAVSSEYVQPHAIKMVRHKRGTLTEPFDADTTIQDLAKGLDVLEKVLAKGKYAAGSKFGYADCYAAPTLYFVKAAGDWYNIGDIFGKRPKLKKYWAAIQKDKLAGPVIQDMADMFVLMKAGKLPAWSAPQT